ncbi:MAG: PEP-utilizing enzyme, partial [Planctomycetales bacterium]
MKIRKGIAVSPGVSVGSAYCIDDIFVSADGELLDQSETAGELERFEEACKKSATELRALHRKVASQVGEHEAAIFKAHETILLDPTFKKKVRKWIGEQRQTAQAALHRVMNEYASLFARTKDEYLKERLADVRDVIVRLSSHLSAALKPDSQALPGPLILVANEVLPSQALALGDRDVDGIVTETGGQTSHAAILARSRGVPAVSGVAGVLRQVKNGDLLIVDGRDGHV